MGLVEGAGGLALNSLTANRRVKWSDMNFKYTNLASI